MEKVALDRGHHKKYLGVVNKGDGLSVGMNADDRVHDAFANTLNCKKKECEAVRYRHCRRGAEV